MHLATAIDDLGQVSQQQGRCDEARRHFREADQLFSELVARDPEHLQPRISLLHTRFNAAVLDRDEGHFEQARSTLVRIRDEVRTLASEGRLEGRPGPFTDGRTLDAMIEECDAGLRKSG